MHTEIKDRKGEIGRRVRLDERGTLFITAAVLLVVILALLAGVGTQWATQDMKRTGDYAKTRRAFYIAETGVQQAVNFFNYDSTGNSPGAATNGFDDELDGSNWPSSLASFTYNSGTVTVSLTDNDDNDADLQEDVDHTVVLTATGSRDDVTSTIEAVIHRPTYKAPSAIITNGNLGGNGSFTVQGSLGSIHSNSNFDQSGLSGSTTQGATASGSCTGAQCVSSGVAKEDIPVIDPADYKSHAQYLLRSDGKIEDKTTSTVYMKHAGCWKLDGVPADPCSGDPVFGDVTQTGGGLWKVQGSVAPDGMYYVEGDFASTSTPDPWTVTILADGYIDFGGNADLVNYNGGPSEDIDNLFLIAGTDLEFSGNPSNTIQGVMAAGEQIDISGTVTLEGYVVASDTADVENLVSPNSTISGSITVTYNGNVPAPFLSDTVIILAWKEV